MIIYVQVHELSCKYMYACKGMFKYLQMHVCVQVHGGVCVCMHAQAFMCMYACEGQRRASAVFCLFVLFIFLAGTLTSLELNKQSRLADQQAQGPTCLYHEVLGSWAHTTTYRFFLMWVLWN